MSSVVTRAGDSFQLDGKTWRARGANFYQLLESTPAEREARLNEFSRLGYNAVRFWCFSKNGRTRDDFYPNLDAILAQADRLGLKLILTLGNNQTDFGGPPCFLKADGKPFDQDNWYRPGGNGLVQEWADQVRTICSRYRGHGAILAWELLNEPTPNYDPVSMGWIDRAAKLVRSADPTHLISSGAESVLPGLYPRADGQDGISVDLTVQNMHPPSVDIVSMHLYAKYLHPKFQPEAWKIAAALAGVAAAADGRPVIVGEWGQDPRDPQPEKDGSQPLGPPMGNAGRRYFLLGTATWIGKLGLAGSFLWSYAHTTDGSFELGPGDPEADYLLRQVRARL